MFSTADDRLKEPADENHVYVTPQKYIKTVSDMNAWENSVAQMDYRGFIMAINEAIRGIPISQGSSKLSNEVLRVMNLLVSLESLIGETPPIEQPQRFGNKAFRDWYQKQKNEALPYLQNCLPQKLHRAIPEIMYYLIDGFGNPVRIDYGTGHEISFIMFLYCLFRIGFLKNNRDEVGVGCAIFPKYLSVARKLQTVYRMEPAGSCGVWSLDDFQFVPFIWGSSQLIGHPKIEPSSFLKPDVIEHYSSEFMFLECIKYINSVKTGPFAEHSHQLWSISGVSNWTKVNTGLLKMYKVEVLSKFPIVQHIVFGSLITLQVAQMKSTLPASPESAKATHELKESFKPAE